MFAVIGFTVLHSRALPVESTSAPVSSIRDLGDQLMTRYVLPMEVLGLLLTAALIGAVIIAAQDNPPGEGKNK